MRTIRIKWLMIAGLATITAMVLFFKPAFAGEPGKAKQSVGLKEARAEVNQAMLNVNQQQKKVNELGEQCKQAKADKNAAVHQQYKDASAELKAKRQALTDAGKALADAHKVIIKEQEGALIAQRKELHKAEAKLNKQLVKRDAAAANQAYVMVAERDKVRDAESRIEYAKINRDVDLYLINKELRDMKGEEWFGLTVMSNETQSMAK